MEVENEVNIFVARAEALYHFFFFGLKLADSFKAHMEILMLEASTLR